MCSRGLHLWWADFKYFTATSKVLIVFQITKQGLEQLSLRSQAQFLFLGVLPVTRTTRKKD